MHAKLPRLNSNDQVANLPRVLTRKAERRVASAKVSIHSNSGDRTSAQLCDVSAYGCNLSCEVEWLRMGRFVTLRLSKDRAIQAIVRWTRGGATGVEFLRPISLGEVEALAGPA